MALNRHKLARYRRQRKQGLFTQLALIIAFVLCYHPLYEQRELFGNRANIETMSACQFYESCCGSVAMV